MAMIDYYNEIDEDKCAWLEELMRDGQINAGVIDSRPIQDVSPADIAEFNQCHFFAGIGVWAYVIKRAGWGDRRLWTGSCPCQPFSSAGRGEGFADERHLWPHWFHLVSICNPAIVLGEQVASKDGRAWFDLVSSDMEGLGYAIGATDTPAAGFGAPEIRQRLHFAGLDHAQLLGQPSRWERHFGHDRPVLGAKRQSRGLEFADEARPQGLARHDGFDRERQDQGRSDAAPSSTMRLADYYFNGQSAARRSQREYEGCYAQLGWTTDRLARDRSERFEMALLDAGSIGSAEGKRQADVLGSDGLPVDGLACGESGGQSSGCGLEEGQRQQEWRYGFVPADRSSFDEEPAYPTNGFWRAADWLYGRDDKWRPVRPRTFPLADGTPARVVRLGGYGDAIVAPQAEEFVRSVRQYVEIIESGI